LARAEANVIRNVAAYAADLSIMQPVFKADFPAPHEMPQENAYRAGPALATIMQSHAVYDEAGTHGHLWQLRSTK
jgi:hypothetical protein